MTKFNELYGIPSEQFYKSLQEREANTERCRELARRIVALREERARKKADGIPDVLIDVPPEHRVARLREMMAADRAPWMRIAASMDSLTTVDELRHAAGVMKASMEYMHTHHGWPMYGKEDER